MAYRKSTKRKSSGKSTSRSSSRNYSGRTSSGRKSRTKSSRGSVTTLRIVMEQPQAVSSSAGVVPQALQAPRKAVF